MKSTGMKDKKGRMIKEGDILQGEFAGMGGVWYEKGTVVWDKGCFFIKTGIKVMPLYQHPKFSSQRRREIL